MNKSLWLLMLVVLNGCRLQLPVSRTVYQPISSIAFPVTTHAVLFEAYNLSEDMSIISTHDDELVLFIVSHDTICFKGDTTFSTVPSRFQGRYETNIDDSSILFDVILFEIDSRRKSDDFIPIVATKRDKLKELFETNDYQGIRGLIQEDDLLFYKQVAASELLRGVEISGAHKGDRYHYSIRLLAND